MKTLKCFEGGNLNGSRKITVNRFWQDLNNFSTFCSICRQQPNKIINHGVSLESFTERKMSSQISAKRQAINKDYIFSSYNFQSCFTTQRRGVYLKVSR